MVSAPVTLRKRIEQSKSELQRIEEEVKDIENQRWLIASKERQRPIVGLAKITRKNSEFIEAWILIQLAFKGRHSWLQLGPERGLTQKELYGELRRHRRQLKETTFRSYLYRLKKADLLWKHKGKWHLTKAALSASVQPARKGEA